MRATAVLEHKGDFSMQKFMIVAAVMASVLAAGTAAAQRPIEYVQAGTLTCDISGGVMVWAVYAPTSRPAGALAGTYGGASAEATVGAGLGANVLVGGSNRTIQLQPLSVQGQTGLNIAAGVSGIDLRWVR